MYVSAKSHQSGKRHSLFPSPSSAQRLPSQIADSLATLWDRGADPGKHEPSFKLAVSLPPTHMHTPPTVNRSPRFPLRQADATGLFMIFEGVLASRMLGSLSHLTPTILIPCLFRAGWRLPTAPGDSDSDFLPALEKEPRANGRDRAWLPGIEGLQAGDAPSVVAPSRSRETSRQPGQIPACFTAHLTLTMMALQHQTRAATEQQNTVTCRCHPLPRRVCPGKSIPAGRVASDQNERALARIGDGILGREAHLSFGHDIGAMGSDDQSPVALYLV